MIREHFAGDRASGEVGFHWRGKEVSRLEGFSDAVFAFAVTLLVVSLEVPKTFHELMDVMRGFPAFGVCFALLANVWYAHYRFFRRYGLQDPWAVILNCVLLFFVLFFVYPLKFLFALMLNGGGQIEAHDGRALMLIYGGGYSAVSLVFVLLYLHALKRRGELALNELELMRTRRSLIDHIAMTAVGLGSMAIALILPLNLVGLAGYFYFMIGVYFTLAGLLFGKRERLLAIRQASVNPPE